MMICCAPFKKRGQESDVRSQNAARREGARVHPSDFGLLTPDFLDSGETNMIPRLIPEQDEVMRILSSTGAFREGHFVYPSGQHTPHYFQMPLAFRYYDTARVLAVALSRK